MSSRKLWIISATTALFLAGCADKTPTIEKKSVQTVEESNITKIYVPQKAYRKVRLKKVEDDNYSSAYMYPEDKVKKEKVVKETKTKSAPDANATATTVVNGMSKDECVGMIGQEKFNKYTQMFGNETASIKRCAMLKAMK